MTNRPSASSRRATSRQQSLLSRISQDSICSVRTTLDIEEQFLHAVEFGDVHSVCQILKEHTEINSDCSDVLGRTALRLAVKNEHLEIVEILLEKSTRHEIYEAVLQAISAGHTQIAETILKHRRFLDLRKEGKKLGATDDFYKTAYPDSQFSPDITPLILASQKNQYEIVQLLLLRGETIMKPHKFSCACQECQNKMKFDQLRLAKYRLNAFRGLASEAYISLSSKDPFLTAFELARELRQLSSQEKHFKTEYRELADQLSDYVVKLLDRIRSQKELELVLNKTGKHEEEKFRNLARFKLALKYKEKKFVAHPFCQQRVVRTWRHGLGRLERALWFNRIVMLLMFMLVYPALVFLHIFVPKSKGAKVLQYPVVKFWCHAVSFILFLILIIVSAWESSRSVSNRITLGSMNNITPQHRYLDLRSHCQDDLYGEDFPLRPRHPSITDLLLTCWIFGMLCQECSQLYQSGFIDHISLYNILDFLLLSAYLATMSLRYFTMVKFHEALTVLSEGSETCANIKSIYWLNTDRLYWLPTDPINVSEGLFALANIMSFFRISYLLAVSEVLGPLQISLGRMLKDIAKFGALFLLVIFAFMVGLHNLYWYYSDRSKIELNYTQHPVEVKAEKHFGDVLATFRTVFWTLFGRGERTVVELGEYNAMTQDIGYFIYGAYNVAMVTVLLNMLIAMMTRSFTRITEDSDREWKFARSLLYMDYIGHGSTLPTPLNLLSVAKGIFKLIAMTVRDEYVTDEEILTENIPLPTLKKNMNEKSLGRIIQKELQENFSTISKSQAFPSTYVSTPDITRRLHLVNTLQESEHLTYQLTMQRIVQRYIFDIQREAEVTEDDFEEIKKDISRFRYDMENQMYLSQRVQEQLKRRVVDIKNEVQRTLQENTMNKSDQASSSTQTNQ